MGEAARKRREAVHTPPKPAQDGPTAAQSLLRFDDVPTGQMMLAKYILKLESQMRMLAIHMDNRDRIQEQQNYEFRNELRRIADMLNELPDELHRVIHMPPPTDDPPPLAKWHPKYERDDDDEYLSFTADGVAVVMQGTGLQRIFREMMRYTLLEVRAFDGKPIADVATRITKLEVRDAHDQLTTGSPARLVK